jgi:hypothetical protein
MNLSLADIVIIPLLTYLITKLYRGMKINSELANGLKKICFIILTLVFFSIFSLGHFLFYDFEIGKSLKELLKFVFASSYGIVFAIYFANKGSDNYESFQITVVYSALLTSICGIFGTVLYRLTGRENMFTMHGGRAVGLMSDTNIMAIFLICSLGVIFQYYLSKRELSKSVVVVGIVLMGIFATASKAAMLVLFLNVIILLLFSVIIRSYKNVMKIMMFLLGMAALLFVIAKSTHILDLAISRISELSSGDANTVTTGRVELWETAIKIYLQLENIIFGIGYGTFKSIAVLFYDSNAIFSANLVHNTLISMLLETGIFSFIVILVSLITLLVSNLRIAIKEKSFDYFNLFWLNISLFIGLNEVNLQNNRFVYIFIAYIYFSLLRENSRNNNKKVITGAA